MNCKYFKFFLIKDIERKIKEVREEKKKEIDFLKIKEEIIKEKILSNDKIEKLKIEDLETLSDIKNISIQEKNRLKEIGLISYLK